MQAASQEKMHTQAKNLSTNNIIFVYKFTVFHGTTHQVGVSNVCFSVFQRKKTNKIEKLKNKNMELHCSLPRDCDRTRLDETHIQGSHLSFSHL